MKETARELSIGEFGEVALVPDLLLLWKRWKFDTPQETMPPCGSGTLSSRCICVALLPERW